MTDGDILLSLLNAEQCPTGIMPESPEWELWRARRLVERIDALVAQRVAEETERCAKIAERHHAMDFTDVEIAAAIRCRQ